MKKIIFYMFILFCTQIYANQNEHNDIINRLEQFNKNNKNNLYTEEMVNKINWNELNNININTEKIDKTNFISTYKSINSYSNQNVKLPDSEEKIKNELLYNLFIEYMKYKQTMDKSIIYNMEKSMDLTMKALNESLQEGKVFIELDKYKDRTVRINNKIVKEKEKIEIMELNTYKWLVSDKIIVKDFQDVEKSYVELYYDKNKNYMKITIKNSNKYNNEYIYLTNLHNQDNITEKYIINLFKTKLNIDLDNI